MVTIVLCRAYTGEITAVPSFRETLAVVEHLGQCLRRGPRILHRVGGLPMPELLLHGRNITRLGNDVLEA